MAFNLSGLSAYVDQTGQTDLITRAVLQPKTVSNMTVKAGLTAGTTNLNILGSTTAIIDATCGFGTGQVSTNATVFTELPLVVKAKMLKETLCPDTLYDVWLSSQLTPTANHDTVPFEAAIADLKIKEINKYVEETIWAGDSATLDGLVSQLDVANGAIDGSSVATAWASTDAVENMWTLIDLIPNALKQEDDLVAYVSYATYSKLVQGLMATGNSILLQYPNITNVTGEAESSFIFPGSNVKVFAAPGLVDETDQSTVFVGPMKYMFFGTGLLDDKDTFKMFYDESNDQVNFMAKFKLGTAVVANQFVSTYTSRPS